MVYLGNMEIVELLDQKSKEGQLELQETLDEKVWSVFFFGIDVRLTWASVWGQGKTEIQVLKDQGSSKEIKELQEMEDSDIIINKQQHRTMTAFLNKDVWQIQKHSYQYFNTVKWPLRHPRELPPPFFHHALSVLGHREQLSLCFSQQLLIVHWHGLKTRFPSQGTCWHPTSAGVSSYFFKSKH